MKTIPNINRGALSQSAGLAQKKNMLSVQGVLSLLFWFRFEYEEASRAPFFARAVHQPGDGPGFQAAAHFHSCRHENAWSRPARSSPISKGLDRFAEPAWGQSAGEDWFSER